MFLVLLDNFTVEIAVHLGICINMLVCFMYGVTALLSLKLLVYLNIPCLNSELKTLDSGLNEER